MCVLLRFLQTYKTHLKNNILSLYPKFDKIRRFKLLDPPMDDENFSPSFSSSSCFFDPRKSINTERWDFFYNKEYVQGPTYVNQQLYTLHQKASTDTLVQVIKFTQTLVTQYETLFIETSNQVSSHEVRLTIPAPNQKNPINDHGK